MLFSLFNYPFIFFHQNAIFWWKKFKKAYIKRKKEDIQELVQTQKTILETCSKYLKEKGELIYATCSIFDEENRKIIEEFLQKNPNFEQVKIDIQKYKEYMDEKGNIQLYQGIENDGFFISKLCKK